MLLPQSSVADQVLVMVDSCGQPPPTTASLNVIATVGSQLSVAVAVPVAGGNVLCPQAIVIFAGQVMTGPTLSSTTIICVQELEFPHPSWAVHVLVMVISCGQAPGTTTSLEPIITLAVQLSVAVAV